MHVQLIVGRRSKESRSCKERRHDNYVVCSTKNELNFTSSFVTFLMALKQLFQDFKLHHDITYLEFEVTSLFVNTIFVKKNNLLSTQCGLSMVKLPGTSYLEFSFSKKASKI